MISIGISGQYASFIWDTWDPVADHVALVDLGRLGMVSSRLLCVECAYVKNTTGWRLAAGQCEKWICLVQWLWLL